ncbi:MAG TPA: hypothetical protein VGK10_02865 [Prolixibacteraceae bacterium]|jgi:hypothetical protein
MKKFKLLILGIALFLLGTSRVSAQIGVSINLNMQPQWGPVEYDHVEYYYMPEYDIYYYAPQRQFVYLRGNNWVNVSNLPYQYRHVDLYNTYKVVINEPKPYLKHKYYAEHYKQFKGQHSKQTLIRDSKDERYARRNEQPTNSGKNMAERAQNRKMQTQHKENMQPQGNKGGNGGEHQGKENKKH